MTARFADTFIAMNKKMLPKDAGTIFHLKNHLTGVPADQEFLVNSVKLKDPTIALVLSLFFGHLGVDRFYNGQTLLGVLKLITVGGVLIWSIIDLFLIMGAVRNKNCEHLMAIPSFPESKTSEENLALDAR